MIPHQLPTCKQALELNPGFCVGGRVLSAAATKLSEAACEPLILSLFVAVPRPRLSSCIIFYLHMGTEEALAACHLSMRLVLSQQKP